MISGYFDFSPTLPPFSSFSIILQFTRDFHPIETSTVLSLQDTNVCKSLNYWPTQCRLPNHWNHFICSLCHVLTSTELLVVPHHPDLERRFDEINQLVQVMAKQARPLKAFGLGAICLARYSKDQLWYRARIQSYEHRQHQDGNSGYRLYVTYLDYMNSEHVSLDDVRVCPTELYKCPARLVRVRLHGIRPHPQQKEQDLQAALRELICADHYYARIVKTVEEEDEDEDEDVAAEDGDGDDGDRGEKSRKKEDTNNDPIPVDLFTTAEMSRRNQTFYKPLIKRKLYIQEKASDK